MTGTGVRCTMDSTPGLKGLSWPSWVIMPSGKMPTTSPFLRSGAVGAATGMERLGSQVDGCVDAQVGLIVQTKGHHCDQCILEQIVVESAQKLGNEEGCEASFTEQSELRHAVQPSPAGPFKVYLMSLPIVSPCTTIENNTIT